MSLIVPAVFTAWRVVRDADQRHMLAFLSRGLRDTLWRRIGSLVLGKDALALRQTWASISRELEVPGFDGIPGHPAGGLTAWSCGDNRLVQLRHRFMPHGDFRMPLTMKVEDEVLERLLEVESGIMTELSDARLLDRRAHVDR